MLGKIIRHNMECVELISLDAFKTQIIEHYRNHKRIIAKVEYSEENDGVFVYDENDVDDFIAWDDLAVDMGWFDQAEIVTDQNEQEKVMVWLNVA